MDLPLYPIKFKPILKEKVWGGTKLKMLLNKVTSSDIVGESWEISDLENNVSVVEKGKLKGKTITELVQHYHKNLMGNKVYSQFGNTFPLLIKFIDAKQDLSVQLHPDDTLAKIRHNSFGKTEMWYILQADQKANLIIDFIEKIDKQTYLKHLEEETLEKILNKEPIQKGDAFYITPGLIHAIGAGTLLAEIQQTSDITYRVYDWNRPDIDGSKRALHNDLAMDAIDFTFPKHFKISKSNPDSVSLLNSPYFTVKIIDTNNVKSRNLSAIDSFVIYMCVEGSTTISINENTELLSMGETVLIPACAKEVHFQKDSAKLLEVFIP
jgi:mannose-6-phosphate isomerase